jgi:hypothetical protein
LKIDVANNEKTLCFMDQKRTAFRANQFCERNGMTLYKADSSDSSMAALVELGRNKLGGSSRAEVYVSGRAGNRCRIFRGNGRLGFASCGITFGFVCEYISTAVEFVPPEPRKFYKISKFNHIFCFIWNRVEDCSTK